jgi:hypothetical protein
MCADRQLSSATGAGMQQEIAITRLLAEQKNNVL